jgi:DNA polymerase-3 subunit epsilon
MGRHQLERISAKEWRCTRCTWTWTRPPKSLCPGVPRHNWWPAVPEHLKTQTQLKEAGLKPAGAVKGCVAGRRDWYWLYDEADAVPRRQATEAQLRALAKARETQERRRVEQERAELEAELAEEEAQYQQCLAERDAAIRWARELLTRTDWVLLDTETTGLDADAQIVQLAVVSTVMRRSTAEARSSPIRR